MDEVSEEHAITATNLVARCHVVNAMKSLPDLPEGLMARAAAMPQPTENAAEVTEEPQVAANEAVEAPTERRTVVQRLRDALAEIFGGSVAMVEQEPPTVSNSSFTLINAILDVESLQERGGFLTLNAAQMGAIEQRLADLVAQVNAANAERDNTLAAIDGISEAVAAIDGVDAKVAAIKDALSKAAGCSTENHAENVGDGHAEDVVLDGVNGVVAQYRR